MTITQHTENQGVSFKPTLFARFKQFINSKPVGCTYTTRELMMTVGIHEKSSSWKRSNGNHHCTTALYQGKLRDFGCLTHVKRGIWKINGHIPEWFSTFHFEFVDSDTNVFDGRRVSCLYWQSLPAEHRVNPWMDVVAARLRKRINKYDAMQAEQTVSRLVTTADSAVIYDENLTEAPIMLAFEQVTFSPPAGLPTVVATVIVGVKRADDGDDGLFETWVEDFSDIQWVDGAVAATAVKERLGNEINYTWAYDTLRNIMGDDEFEMLKGRLGETAVNRVSNRYNVDTKKDNASVEDFAKSVLAYMESNAQDLIEDEMRNIEDDVELELDYKQISVSVDTRSISRNCARSVIDSLDCWIDDYIGDF